MKYAIQKVPNCTSLNMKNKLDSELRTLQNSSQCPEILFGGCPKCKLAQNIENSLKCLVGMQNMHVVESHQCIVGWFVGPSKKCITLKSLS